MRQMMPDIEPLVPPPLLDRRQAATILGISTRTLSRLAKRGEIPFVRVGSSHRFTVEDLKAFIGQNRVFGDD
jgi:excisionase family DNA binding protein